MTSTSGISTKELNAEIKVQNAHNADEAKRLLAVRARQQAQKDMAKNIPTLKDIKAPKTVESAKPSTKQSSTTAKEEIVAKKAEKVAKTARPKPQYIQYLTGLLSEGKYTRKELVDMAVKQCPETSKSSIETVITDSQNVKYNRFPLPVIKTKEGKMSFKK